MPKYNCFGDVARTIGHRALENDRSVVCIQGLGFVGAAMAVAIAMARDVTGSPVFNVIGVDLPTPDGAAKIAAINNGTLPFSCEDSKLATALNEVHRAGNLIATADPEVFGLASTIVVDVNLDVIFREDRPYLALDGFRAAIRVLGERMPPGCLVIIESTVPPGACEKVVAPILASAFRERSLPANGFLLAHAYERVMPGKEYFDSIVNFWRVYAGYTPEAADACEAFLSKVINVQDYPLTRLSSTSASEIGKLLENSYRAANIAFIEEWGRFAESLNIDLFEVINAIRKRPTHSNIRQPGFGVGGYCLTKDPLMAEIAAKELLDLPSLKFPFSTMAVAVNRAMPLVSLERVESLLGGNLRGKTILLLGVSYRQDVGDTRNSPAQIFVEAARARGARVKWHDPYVRYWPELEEYLPEEASSLDGVHAVIFAVPHEYYLRLDMVHWLDGFRPVILDANNVLSKDQLQALRASGCRVERIGCGAS